MPACSGWRRRIRPRAVAWRGAASAWRWRWARRGGAGLLLFAWLLPLVFGAAYAALPWLVRWLALMPVLFGAFVIGADLLTAMGRQSHRLGVVVASLAMTLAMCWWLTPVLGLEGAILARLGVQALTAALVWALALRGAAR